VTTRPVQSDLDGDEVLDAALLLEPESESNPIAAGWRRAAYTLLANRNLTISVAGLIVFVFFSMTTRQFLTPNNLLNVVRNVSLIGIVAVGMTFLLVAGEIDLSVGSVYGVLTVGIGLLVSTLGLDPWLATLVAIGAGVAIALTCLWGGVYPLPHTALLLGGYAALCAAFQRSWRPLARPSPWDARS